ncbi:TIGR03790 family protein [Aliirhizobium smilacinae]|uniref:TIGR03790 family protein n=1 Tax=Aliirhizobium smilacinae TaxID=1395944 RepID=UPI0015D6050E|nr:TIGR03790 family protein [Rhizobium smilacinae]
MVPLTSNHQQVLTPGTLGVIINLSDPDSVALGAYYARLRHIPVSNIIGLHLPIANSIDGQVLSDALLQLHRATNYGHLLAFALAFSKPYRVDENQSITSAFAQGIARSTWIGSCNLTRENPDKALGPGAELSVKPAFLLDGGGGIASSMALVRRGKAGDASDPAAAILLAGTDEGSRSLPREPSMKNAANTFPDVARFEKLSPETFSNAGPLIGFETGLASIPKIHLLEFLPGAFADSLTSYGGAINDNVGQTTASQMIRAGATASFGTVREPCNFKGKFPDPTRVIANYLAGDSILEAYWKSVDMTTEGLFIGEPLTRPFPILDAKLKDGLLVLRANKRTLRYLDRSFGGNIGANERSIATDATIAFGLYSVETGSPHLVQEIVIPNSIKPGQIIATVPFATNNSESTVLGILRH